MNIQDCASFEGCSAPICPLDDSAKCAVWYADEPICVSRKHKGIFAKTQRKISKIKNVEGYFTLDMLNSISRVAKGISGITPDSRQSEDVWTGKRQRRTGRPACSISML